jgi:hypothetical protein
MIFPRSFDVGQKSTPAAVMEGQLFLECTVDTARAVQEVQEYIMKSDHSEEGQKTAVNV